MAKAKTKPPTLSLTTTNGPQLLPQQWIDDLGIKNGDLADFSKCLEIIHLQMAGSTITQAYTSMGLGESTFYSPHWRKIMGKARQVIASFMIQGAQNAASRVYAEWPAIIESMINVAKNGRQDHEKVKAAELLATIYIVPLQEAPVEDSAQVQYLNKKHNFNPSVTPIQVNEGGTVNIISAQQPPSSPDEQ
jgi:hypothetical protein